MINVLTSILNTIAIISGAIVAWIAVLQYRGQNQISMEKTLIDADSKIWQRIENEPELDAFFMEFDENVEPVSKAKLQLNALVPFLSSPDIPFSSITSFENWAWNEADFFSPTKTRLRAAYGLGESIIYVVSLAYDARQRKLLSEEDYRAWTTYIDTVGSHPMFLCGLFYWQKNGFASDGFFNEVRSRLLANESNRRTIMAIFPEFANGDRQSY
jgi:hypothetical protein